MMFYSVTNRVYSKEHPLYYPKYYVGIGKNL
jgi:hypothetical protein